MMKIDCPKLVKSSIILSILFLVLFPNSVLALSSDTINFQGKIVRNDTGYEGLNVTAGSPACVVAGNTNDTCDFQVRYYSASTGGTLLLTEVYANAEIGQYNGAFTLSLGSDGSPTAGSYASFDAMIKGVTDLYVQLGFSPDGDSTYTETFSRMPIQASAYALKAKYASGANTAFQFDTATDDSGYTSPSAGMVYYDTTDDELKVYDGSSWGGLGGSTGGSLFTDGVAFTYLTSLTDHFVLGASSYTAIGSDSYATYLTGITTRPPFSFDMTAERLTLSGSQAQSGLTVYSNYASTGGWPVASFKAEDSGFDSVVMQITQDGIGDILSLQKGSTDAFIFENPLTFYIHPRTDAPTVSANRLYNINGTLYWNGSAVGSGGSGLWTDSDSFTYLTSITDDVVIGGSTEGTAKFFFDVSTGNLGIGTSTPGAKLDIAGSSSTITNSTGDITLSPDETVVIKANDTDAENLMEWQNSTGTVLGLVNQNGYATFGSSTSAGAMLTLGASTSTVAQINLASGADVSAPGTGDMWWNGTELYFFDGSESLDLLTSGGGFVGGLAVSDVPDGPDAIAFQFNTATAYTDASSKLLSVMNNSVEKMYLDANGNLYVSGTITSGKGLSAALVNNSGGIVTERSLVTADSSTNNAFTTTTVAGLKGALGVVQGVELNGDVDSDGVCDNGDTCLVAFEGVVNINLDNAASSSKGDYIYSSTTAMKGHASSNITQTDGLLGVVISTANTGSGYVQMVFDAQNKVTAEIYLNVGFDKNAYRDMYNQLANDYLAMNEAERRGLLESGQSQSVMFDNFVDSLKIDSANSTIGIDSNAQKAGLWGGLTVDGTTLDIDGNRYLGSATATLLTSKYYDRTQSGLQDQDSTPETMVDIGVDPNWYKGVSLQTITNLTTSYNGSLIGVSGVYGTGSEHGYIDLTITGTTTTGIVANIASSDGNCTATSASLAFGSSYAFTSGSCSGSSITIKPVRSLYNSGDKFRIASWFVEPTTSDDRGTKREFPERALIFGSADTSYIYVSIVDVDTQKVWMKFNAGTNAFATAYMLVNNTSRLISAIDMLNGKLYVVGNTSSGNVGDVNIDFISDSATAIFSPGLYKFGGNIGGRHIASAYTIVNSNLSLATNYVNDVSSAVIPNQPTQEIVTSGWGYAAGADSTYSAGDTILLPYTFNSIPNVVVAYAGRTSSGVTPSSLEDCITTGYSSGYTEVFQAYLISENKFLVRMRGTYPTYTSAYNFCYTWTATGEVSPKQFVAYATGDSTSGGTEILNETDQSVVHLVSNDGVAYSQIWENKVALAENELYVAVNNASLNASYIYTYQGVHGLITEATGGSFRRTYYNLGASTGSRPSILGPTTGTLQINSLVATSGTSTTDGKSNTIYVGTPYGLSVIQEKQSTATSVDGMEESEGFVRYYSKYYISEQMSGYTKGMWPLNYVNTGADNEDVSFNANSLTATNIDSSDSVSGVRGTAIDLNGTDEYLSRATDTDFDLGNAMTMSAWTYSSGGRMFNRYGYDSGGSVATNAYYFFGITGGKPFVALRDDTDGTAQTVTANTTVSGGWHHLVAVIDKDAALVSIYVDGVLEVSTTLTETGTYTFDDPFRIGGYLSSAGVFSGTYTGLLDEISVSAQAITPAQIKSQYEDGLRALKGSHSTADTYNQFNGSSMEAKSILVTPDSRYMYVGTEGGGISKIDLTSSTTVSSYTTATDPLTSTNNIETISGRDYPVFSGDIGVSGRLMGVDSNGNNSTGTYYSRTMVFDDSTNRAFLWTNANIDSTDTSSSITVSASNDNGANYVVGTLLKTNTTGTLPEYEYSFEFPTLDKNYKVKFEIARGTSNKATTYITKWGLSQMSFDSASANGLFTNSNDTVANGSYLDVYHGQNTYNLVANGWVFDTTLSQWMEITNTDSNVTQNLSNQWNDAAVGGIIRTTVGTTDIALNSGKTYGLYNSPVISTPNAQSYDNLKWESALNTYGKISVQTRSGATNDPTDGTWEGWKPFTLTTNYLTLETADTHTTWTGTNATVAEGDVTRDVSYFEDEDESLATNLTKVTSSTNGGYMESTITAANLSTYDYITFWVRASQTGAVLRIGMGEAAATEQYEDITIDTADTWQKVYWDISDITGTSRDAITKLRLTNFATSSNVIYLDNIRGEKLLSTGAGNVVTSTPNSYLQYRVIFTTTNVSNLPTLENISLTYSSGFKIQIIDANTVRLYNNSGKTQKLKLDVILGASIDMMASQYSVNIAPTSAQVDGDNNTNSIWINKLGTGGNLLKLQTNGADMMVVSSEGDMTLAGDVAVAGGSITLGATGDQGSIRYNATNNEIEFSNDGTTWLPLGGLGRKVTLSAEYPGAVLSGDGTDNVGAMISDNTGSSSNSMNYYDWSSSALALNDYDVRVRFTLPSDFDGWGSAGGVTLNLATESTSNTNNKVDMYIYREDSATIDGTSTANVSSSAGVWKTATIAGTDLTECATAGDVCVFIMRMYSLSDNYVRIGDIAITYNRSL